MLSYKGFDKWSGEYDDSIQKNSKGYPFEGYYEVLSYVQNLIKFDNQVKIFDIGIGTGLLTKQLYKRGAVIYGMDFSRKMLEIAKIKMPNGIFYCGNFKFGLPEELKKEKYDYIVSSYAIHHINEDAKIRLIKELKKILKKNGKIIIADIAFETKEKMIECKHISGKLWDDDEHYLVAEDIKNSLINLGFKVQYTQVSFYAGVLEII